jgi:hypothetical protein
MAQSVDAKLSADMVRVGQAVELRITAKGASQARMMTSPNVEGLVNAGNQQQFQMEMALPKFGVQVTTVHTFILVPSQPGEFTIPPQKVSLDGKVYQTKAMTIQVTPASGGNVPVRPAIPVPQSGPAQQNLPPPDTDESTREKGYFGEMVIPKTSAYVGEVVPVDLRFNIVANVPAQFSDRPNLSGEGFTVSPNAKPSQVEREVGGVDYSCAIYRTAITPAKAGTLEIPPASLAARVQVPVQVPGGDDFFGGMLRNFGMTDVREIEIATQGATLDVKPLPRDGRPEDFAGAVGEFKILAKATPSKVASGEPITLRVVVSGRGNFEAMGPPVLAESEGWKVYDPSEEFEPSPSDPIGFNGKKTYTFTLVARQDQTATPPVKFTYFDPAQEKYVTLEAPPVAVQAAGSAAASPTPATTAGSSPTAGSAATPVAPPASSGDLITTYTRGSFEPAAWSKGFVYSALGLGAIWVLGLGVWLAKKYADSPAAERARQSKAIRSRLKSLEDASLSDVEFLERAVELIDQAGAIPQDSLNAIAQIRDRYEEIKYSTRRPASIPAETRREMVDSILKLHAKRP